jgi:hypothetical protein
MGGVVPAARVDGAWPGGIGAPFPRGGPTSNRLRRVPSTTRATRIRNLKNDDDVAGASMGGRVERERAEQAEDLPEIRPWCQAGWVFRDGDARAIERRVAGAEVRGARGDSATDEERPEVRR